MLGLIIILGFLHFWTSFFFVIHPYFLNTNLGSRERFIFIGEDPGSMTMGFVSGLYHLLCAVMLYVPGGSRSMKTPLL